MGQAGRPNMDTQPIEVDLDIADTGPVDLGTHTGEMSPMATRDLRIEAWRKRLELKITGILYARFDTYYAATREFRERINMGLAENFGKAFPPSGEKVGDKGLICASIYRSFLEQILDQEPFSLDEAITKVERAIGVEFDDFERGELEQDRFLQLVLSEELVRVMAVFK